MDRSDCRPNRRQLLPSLGPLLPLVLGLAAHRF